MLIFIHGSDSYLAADAIRSIKHKYLEKNPTGSELIEIDASEPLPNFADLRAVPLFASSRLIIVKRAGELLVNDQNNLASMLTDLPTSSIVVIWDSKPLKAASALSSPARKTPASLSSPDARKTPASLSHICDKAAKKISAEPLVGSRLAAWVKTEIATKGQAAQPGQIDNLTQQYGNDLWAIKTALASGYLVTTKEQISDWGHTEADKTFILFDDIRSKRWDQLKKHIVSAYERGEALELTIGTLAAAIRQCVSDSSLRCQLTNRLSEIDLALKTGLIEASDAAALLVYYLPDGQNRVQWEELWQVIS